VPCFDHGRDEAPTGRAVTDIRRRANYKFAQRRSKLHFDQPAGRGAHSKGGHEHPQAGELQVRPRWDCGQNAGGTNLLKVWMLVLDYMPTRLEARYVRPAVAPLRAW
jgi:hypothetical protein